MPGGIGKIFSRLFPHVEPVRKHYDPQTQKPAIRCSICTGEQVAGFLDQRTGKFLEIQLLQSPEDLERFKRDYGISEDPEKFY